MFNCEQCPFLSYIEKCNANPSLLLIPISGFTFFTLFLFTPISILIIIFIIKNKKSKNLLKKFFKIILNKLYYMNEHKSMNKYELKNNDIQKILDNKNNIINLIKNLLIILIIIIKIIILIIIDLIYLFILQEINLISKIIYVCTNFFIILLCIIIFISLISFSIKYYKIQKKLMNNFNVKQQLQSLNWYYIQFFLFIIFIILILIILLIFSLNFIILEYQKSSWFYVFSVLKILMIFINSILIVTLLIYFYYKNWELINHMNTEYSLLHLILDDL
jgi:hypothetical protein